MPNAWAEHNTEIVIRISGPSAGSGRSSLQTSVLESVDDCSITWRLLVGGFATLLLYWQSLNTVTDEVSPDTSMRCHRQSGLTGGKR